MIGSAAMLGAVFLASGEWGFAQPALLVVWSGALFVGAAAGGRPLAGAIGGATSAALGGAAIVIGIGLKENVSYAVSLPVMIPLASIPGLMLGIGGACFAASERTLGHEHRCEKCGYDLTGNVSGRCPECGTPVSAVNKGDADL
jgi:hypothetical protein